MSGSGNAAFIFDIDGTIIDSMPSHEEAWVEFFRRKGQGTLGTDFFARTAGRTGFEVMREYFGGRGDDELRALVEEKEAIYRDIFGASFREVPGFAAFAHAARAAGIRLACATAGDARNIAFAMSNLGMEGFFDAVAGGHEVAHGKPAPDLFLLAARRIGADPAQSIVFEDAPLGIEGARRAGMAAVGLATSLASSSLDAPHVVALLDDYRATTPQAILVAAQARAQQARTGTDA
jgi:HAD superfamily hydrolase (TIGR01509 family)